MQIHVMEHTYTPWANLLADWIVRRNRVMLSSSGGPKMQEARHESYQQGRREMMCEILAQEVNQRRIDRFSTWKQVPIFLGVEMEKTLRLMEETYELCHEPVDPFKPDGAKQVDWDKFFGQIDNVLDSLAFSDDLMDADLQRHRQAVLDGFEQPNADDVVWLVEEQGKASDEAKRFSKLSALAERAKDSNV